MCTFVKNHQPKITKMKRILSISILMMVSLLAMSAVYEPTLSSDSEVCVFFEANSTVTISGMEPQSQIAIVDMNGREVYKLHTTNAQHTIDISQFAKGAYFVRITGERTNVIRKLVVK